MKKRLLVKLPGKSIPSQKKNLIHQKHQKKQRKQPKLLTKNMEKERIKEKEQGEH